MQTPDPQSPEPSHDLAETVPAAAPEPTLTQARQAQEEDACRTLIAKLETELGRVEDKRDLAAAWWWIAVEHQCEAEMARLKELIETVRRRLARLATGGATANIEPSLRGACPPDRPLRRTEDQSR